MPKRTNKFQTLIFAIEKSLANSEWKVIESNEFLDPDTNVLREIDIFIERIVYGKIERIAIECRDYSRPQGIDFIEMLRGKYEDPIARGEISKVIAVSSDGFYEPAKIKASKWGIETYDFEEANAIKWMDKLGHHRTIISKNEFLNARITMHLKNGDVIRDLEKIARWPVLNIVGKKKRYLTLFSFIRQFKKAKEQIDIEASRLAFSKGLTDDKYICQIKYPVQVQDFFLISDNGEPIEIIEVTYEWIFRLSSGSSEDAAYKYNGTDVLMGSTLFDKKRFDMTFVNQGNKFKVAQCFVDDETTPTHLWQKKLKKRNAQ